MKNIKFIIALTIITISPVISFAQVSEILRVPDNNIDNQVENFDMTTDARYIVFDSYADSLVVGDDNGLRDIFLFDATLDTLELVSGGLSGADANNESRTPSISDDGRFVTFLSLATNLVAGDTNGFLDVFVYDRDLDSIERVSLTDLGGQITDGHASSAHISGNGRYVTYSSEGTDVMSGGDLNIEDTDIFVFDRDLDTTERVTENTLGVQADNSSDGPIITPDGRYVTFISVASNLATGDTNGEYDVFVRDRNTDITEAVSINDDGDFSAAGCDSSSISSDGRYVVFRCANSSDWVEGLPGGIDGVFIYDRNTDNISLISVAKDGTAPDGNSYNPFISGDGRYVLFSSDATNLIPNDTNARTDYFIKDILTGLISRISESADGVESDGDTTKARTKLTENGGYSIFISGATNLVTGDTNDVYDIFRVKLSDNDGISDAEEEAGPNSGDVDEDGYIDSMEHDTTTLENSVTSDYMAIISEGECFDNEDVSLLPESSLSVRDAQYNYPTGVLDFSINCRTTTGDSADVTIYLFGGVDITGLALRKVGTDGVSMLVPGASVVETTVDGQDAIEITYSITDGSLLDEDGLVNGIIIDPVGLAVAGAEVAEESSGGGSSSGSRTQKKLAIVDSKDDVESESCHIFVTNMKIGSKFGEVVELQKTLNANGFNSGITDGLFGPMTNTAVKAFQVSNGLVSDGIVGPITRAKLNECK